MVLITSNLCCYRLGQWPLVDVAAVTPDSTFCPGPEETRKGVCFPSREASRGIQEGTFLAYLIFHSGLFHWTEASVFPERAVWAKGKPFCFLQPGTVFFTFFCMWVMNINVCDCSSIDWATAGSLQPSQPDTTDCQICDRLWENQPQVSREKVEIISSEAFFAQGCSIRIADIQMLQLPQTWSEFHAFCIVERRRKKEE